MSYNNKNSILLCLLISGLFAVQEEDFSVPGYDCGDCHGSGGWDRLTLKGFNHSSTAFPLDGIHQIQTCGDCHTGSSLIEKHDFSQSDSDCNSCHIDVHKGELGQECVQCHTTQSWTVSQQSFNHNTTQFPLTNGHQSVDCIQCHEGLTPASFTLTPTECYACHVNNYDETGTPTYPNSPNHTSLNYNHDCTTCHSTNSWVDIGFNHDDTNYPLKDAHETTPCLSCHSNGVYSLPNSCDGCHIEGGVSLTNATQSTYNHESHNINSNCESCHSSISWTQILFDHVNFTSIECQECHLIEHTNSTDPPHSNGNIDLTCNLCHSTSDWSISPFEHSLTQTGYLLEGAHGNVNCTGCHLENVFASTPQDCWSCHLNEFDATGTPEYPNSPDHNTYEYSQECNFCHSMETWEGAEFDHNETDFPLTGLHLDAECETCHANNSYDLPLTCDGCHIETGLAETNSSASEYDHLSHQIDALCELCHTTDGWDQLLFDHVNFTTIDCQECHLIEHTTSENPPHGNGNISDQCEVCHDSNESWLISSFLHSTEQTDYELTGIHITTDCELCHISQIYNSTPNSCENEACHLNDFEETTDPNHGEYSFPISYCSQCHSTLGWEPDIFEHDVTDACINCHLPDYNSATDPPHSQLSTTCDDCHTSTTTWDEATFSHDGISTDCQSCHLEDYNETSSHVNENYPMNCESCHTSTDDWEDTSFDHDVQFFPIYSGEHEGEWSTCTNECHIEPEDYAVFSCGLNGVCHEHDQDEMDDEHDDENDYVYESTACFDCHPDGESDDDLRGPRHRSKIEMLKKFPEYLPK